jgi:hypothetical protein
MGDGATAEHLEATFKKEIRIHLTEVNKMMATTSPASIIGTQTIALQHFTSILPELAKIIPTIELVTIATNFVNAISTGKGKIIIWRLIMYLQIVKGFLFDNPSSRSLLVQAVVIWIKPHFGRYDEFTQTATSDSDSVRDLARVSWLESIRLCVTILAVMLDKLQLQLVSSSVMADRNLFRQEQENIEYILMLMPRCVFSILAYLRCIHLFAGFSTLIANSRIRLIIVLWNGRALQPQRPPQYLSHSRSLIHFPSWLYCPMLLGMLPAHH